MCMNLWQPHNKTGAGQLFLSSFNGQGNRDLGKVSEEFEEGQVRDGLCLI